MIDSMTLRNSADDLELAGTESFVSSGNSAHTTLTKEQGLALLSKLATDDVFRTRFEQKPAHALSEMGIPAQQIVELPATCLTPRALASKQEMNAAKQRLATDLDTSALALTVPTLKISTVRA